MTPLPTPYPQVINILSTGYLYGAQAWPPEVINNPTTTVYRGSYLFTRCYDRYVCVPDWQASAGGPARGRQHWQADGTLVAVVGGTTPTHKSLP